MPWQPFYMSELEDSEWYTYCVNDRRLELRSGNRKELLKEIQYRKCF